jgi:putative colanic acid biosynthesis glycosyltransferase
MKILLIDVNYKNSSTGKLVFDLKNGINNKGYEAYVAYGRGKDTKDKNVFKFGYTIETYIDALLTRITGFVGYFSFFSTFNLINLIKKIKPNIIHIHEIHSYFINIPIFLKFLSDNPTIKIIWTFHSEFMYTGKCGNSLSCEKWKKGCNKCPLIREYPKTLIFDFTKKMYFDKKRLINKLNNNNTTIVTPSNWLSYRTSLSMFSKFKIKTINNGIDAKNIFHYYQYDEEFLERFHLPKKYLLSVAPNIMERNKGGKTIIEIAKKLPDIFFVMVGFKKIPKNLPTNVIPFLKTSDQITLAKFYSFASLFLITSQIENLPTTCLESLCCGTKIIGFNVGGVSETTKNTAYGFFFRYGDIDSVKNKIIEMFNISYDKYEVSKFGTQNYDLDICLNSYINLYNE